MKRCWIPVLLLFACPATAQKKAGATKPPLQLDTVVVTGSRTEHQLSDSPVATEVISRKDVEASGAENAAAALRGYAGIQMVQSFSGEGVRLQGLEAKHVLILIDGERIGGRKDGVIDLTRISAEHIERIEIVKGPSSALYGSDAMGGVINIITRRSLKPIEASGHLSYGNGNTVSTTGKLGFRTGQWSSLLTGGWNHKDAYDLSPNDQATTGSELSQWDIANRTSYRFKSGSKLSFRAEYLRRDMLGLDANSKGAVFDRKNVTETLNTWLTPEIKLWATGKLKLSLNYSLYRDQFVYDQHGSTKLDKDEETREQLGQVTLQYDQVLGESHLLTIGIEGLYEHLDSVRLKSGEGDRHRASLFAQNEWTVLDTPVLILSPGARLDVDSQFGTHATPKINLRYDPHPSLKLRTSYGMGFRAPVFKELLLVFENPSVGYVVEGNQDLKPETSHSVNVGAEWNLMNLLWVSLNLFYNDISNLIFTELEPDGDAESVQRWRYVNIASAITQGLEINTSISPLRGLTIETGYALTDTKNEKCDLPLVGRARHRATFDVRHNEKDWGFDVAIRGAVTGPRPFYSTEGGACPTTTQYSDISTTLDFRMGQYIGPYLKLFAGIQNILDAGDHRELPIQPRTFYGGLTGGL